MEQVQAYTEEQLAAMNWAFEKSGAPTEELFVHVDYSVLGTLASQEVIDTFKGARAIALDNAPAGMPTMFLRGKDLPNGLTFFNIAAVSEDDGTYLPILASIGVQTSDPFLVTPIIIRDDVKYGFVRYDEPQTLTNVQKDQARVNINVKSPDELANDTTLAALRYVAQALTAAQQMQVYTNLGLKVYITNSSILGTTVSAAVGAAIRAASILLLADTNETYFLGSSNPARFYSFFNSGYIKEISVTDANIVSTVNSRSYVDNVAVHFTAQSLSDAQKLQARTNIGVETPLETAENTQFQQKLCEQPTFAQALMIPVVGIISDDDMLEAIAAAMSQSATLAAVRYVTQNLTDEHKATARENIGVATPAETGSNADFQEAFSTSMPSNAVPMNRFSASMAVNLAFYTALLNNNPFITGVAGKLLANNDFITELKAKLGIA